MLLFPPYLTITKGLFTVALTVLNYLLTVHHVWLPRKKYKAYEKENKTQLEEIEQASETEMSGILEL